MVIGVPRLRIGGSTLPPPAFYTWFGMTIEEVQTKYKMSGIIGRDALGGKRPTNKARMPIYHNRTGTQEPALFDLRARGHSLPPPIRDDGSDVDDRMSIPPADEPRDIDEFLSRLYRQFVIDVLGKAPNMKGATNASYMRLTALQRREGTDVTFKNLTLSTIWNHVAYRTATTADWQRAFKWLFPSRGFKTTDTVQNYPSCPYFRTWMEFLENAENSQKLVSDAREALWKLVRTWSWIPDAQQDKMWPTPALKGFTRWPHILKSNGKDLPAPRILLKNDAQPTFTLTGGDDEDDGNEDED